LFPQLAKDKALNKKEIPDNPVHPKIYFVFQPHDYRRDRIHSLYKFLQNFLPAYLGSDPRRGSDPI